MRRVTEHLRAHLLLSCGLVEGGGARTKASLEELQESEWCPHFEKLQRARLIMGAFRYGRLGEAGKPQWDRITRIQWDVARYQATGNLEHLVDAANHCMLEFVEGRHPKRHLAEHTKTEKVKACPA